ncbi:MAG: hypothetical protein ACM33B_08795 [Pseudomonadota bacterium]
MLGPGDRCPDVVVWTAPREKASTLELGHGGATLFLFYLFDWTGT